MNNATKINIGTYPGRKHFELFSQYTDPTYGMTSQLDITAFYRYVKEKQMPVYFSLIYLITQALNQIMEFRLRYDGKDIVLFDKIDPAFTIMTDVGRYDNCDNVNLRGNVQIFIADAQTAVAEIKTGSDLAKPQADERLDQFYLSSAPWVEFIAVSQPMNNNLFAYIPRIVWDKFHITDDKVTVHMNIVVHHGLIDGKPLAEGFLKIQEYLANPRKVFSE